MCLRLGLLLQDLADMFHCSAGNMDSDAEDVIITILLWKHRQRFHRVKRITWMTPWLQKRPIHRAYNALINELQKTDPKGLRKKTSEFDKFVKNDKCTRRNTGFPSKVTSEKVFSALEKKAKNLRN